VPRLMFKVKVAAHRARADGGGNPEISPRQQMILS
jgi:hypothetical protein